MGNTYYKSGAWNVICDRCGQKKKSTDVKQEWTGFIVCTDCYESRHPMDFIKTRADKMTVPFSRPRPPDVFIDVPYILQYVESDYIAKGYFEEF